MRGGFSITDENRKTLAIRENIRINAILYPRRNEVTGKQAGLLTRDTRARLPGLPSGMMRFGRGMAPLFPYSGGTVSELHRTSLLIRSLSLENEPEPV